MGKLLSWRATFGEWQSPKANSGQVEWCVTDDTKTASLATNLAYFISSVVNKLFT